MDELDEALPWAEVVCLGESMALFVPAEPGPVHQARTWTRTVGGAESNVACHLARLGWRSQWVSALGNDAFGLAVLDWVRNAGVDVTQVRVDPQRPTGFYVKEADANGSRVRYCRAGSAASAMGPDLLGGLALDRAELVHISGITAALSDSCLALLRSLLAAPRGAALVSFDVNWRPALWKDRDPGVLAELANQADVVLVGADEAEALWGSGEPEQVRRLLPAPQTLVIKQGEHGAVLVERNGTGDTTVFEPALAVDVVEPVGAGDAFAAGFLSAHLRGQSSSGRLRHGHLLAAATLLTRDDVGVPLPPTETAILLSADEQTWRKARVTAQGVVMP